MNWEKEFDEKVWPGGTYRSSINGDGGGVFEPGTNFNWNVWHDNLKSFIKDLLRSERQKGWKSEGTYVGALSTSETWEKTFEREWFSDGFKFGDGDSPNLESIKTFISGLLIAERQSFGERAAAALPSPDEWMNDRIGRKDEGLTYIPESTARERRERYKLIRGATRSLKALFKVVQIGQYGQLFVECPVCGHINKDDGMLNHISHTRDEAHKKWLKEQL